MSEHGWRVGETRQNLMARNISQSFAPNNAPTPAVRAMANAPQKVTRAMDFQTGAPPTRAAKAPNNPKNKRELPETTQTSLEAGATKTSNNGRAAPTVKVAADAKAA